MTETLIWTGIAAGYMSATTLGWLHYELKPEDYKIPATYFVGSSSCMSFTAIATAYLGNSNLLAFLLSYWGIVTALGMLASSTLIKKLHTVLVYIILSLPVIGGLCAIYLLAGKPEYSYLPLVVWMMSGAMNSFNYFRDHLVHKRLIGK